MKKDNETSHLNFTESTLIQRLAGKPKYIAENGTEEDGQTKKYISYSYPVISKEYGQTVSTEFGIACDLVAYKKMPRFSFLLGYVCGALVLGFGEFFISILIIPTCSLVNRNMIDMEINWIVGWSPTIELKAPKI